MALFVLVVLLVLSVLIDIKLRREPAAHHQRLISMH